TNRSCHCPQDRHVMTKIAALRRHTDYLAQRWLRNGGDRARTEASSHHQSQPATATLNDNLDHQAKLLWARCIIGRLASKAPPQPRSPCPPQTNPPSARCTVGPQPPAGSFFGGFRTPAADGCRTAFTGRHPKPCTVAAVAATVGEI